MLVVFASVVGAVTCAVGAATLTLSPKISSDMSPILMPMRKQIFGSVPSFRSINFLHG
jgi:hypothetical protein